MITRLAESTACFFVSKNIIRSDEKEIYAYGMGLILTSIVNILAVILIAVITDTVLYTALFVIPMLVMRRFIGGYHADTRTHCLLLLILSLAAFYGLVFFIPQCITKGTALVLAVFSMLSVEKFAPVEHPNKPLSARLGMQLKTWGMIACSVFVAAECIFIAFGQYKPALCIAFGIAVSAAAMTAQKRKNDRTDRISPMP